MSEEILKALMQLFAIISKQDEGITAHQRRFVESFLMAQLNIEKVNEYLRLYDEKSNADEVNSKNPDQVKNEKLTSMKDSVRTLSICRKINKTLSQKQKVIVLIRIFELLKAEQLYTEQRMSIIETVANVFNISAEELALISNFSREDELRNLDSEEILVIEDEKNHDIKPSDKTKYIFSSGLDGKLYILKIKSVELYFIKYKGSSEITLNGLNFNQNNIYLFPPGSTLRLPKGTIYYSDIVSKFLKDGNIKNISFKAEKITFKFPNNKIALRNINIAEEFGLIGIMGSSGSGKTTLLNVLSGIEKPFEGTVRINGIDIFQNSKKAKALIGYIAQDDFLFEDLTVFQNLYYNAKLCFKDLPESEILGKVENTLANLGLSEIKDIKVGSPLNKKISGGQRKRLNIALELIREPSVLFVDEPTSGLSSKDSENVMDLLKELSLNMKLIFVVIHQPSSDIFKMFDKLFILDNGGYSIYYGNPVESLVYFKQITNQINADAGECVQCGNVNPEMLFNIIVAKEVDDYGRFTSNRIKTPAEWNEIFLKNNKIKDIEEIKDSGDKSLQIPSRINQFLIFVRRDVLSKISNKQYLLINLFETPLLALILTIIIKFSAGIGGEYIFKDNDNIPPYIFLSIIIALFVGLSVSAEEIFRDRKILKREAFLNLSRSSYLLSKVVILFTLSALQTITFVLIGNTILEIKGLYFEYWLILFITSCFANIMGLNISSTFNSAVTIYILIPLLVIPQMVLGGAMFSFDKLNTLIGGGQSKSPVIADIMVSRWAYEAIAVTQFKDNPYEKKLYSIEKIESQANYKQVYYISELEKILKESENIFKNKDDSSRYILKYNLEILKNEISSESRKWEDIKTPDLNGLSAENLNEEVLTASYDFLEQVKTKYIKLFNIIDKKKNDLIEKMKSEMGKNNYLSFYKNNYNDFLAALVKKSSNQEKLMRIDNRLVQIADPVFKDPDGNRIMSLRAHFYAPYKYFLNYRVNTLYFNLGIICLFTLILYICLYFDFILKFLNLFNRKKQ
jgi:ABC transport system ATP-binding/permease protein